MLHVPFDIQEFYREQLAAEPKQYHHSFVKWWLHHTGNCPGVISEPTEQNRQIVISISNLSVGESFLPF